MKQVFAFLASAILANGNKLVDADHNDINLAEV